MTTYKVNEIFQSIQGEGIDTGKHVTFIRLAGCNMNCSFCDTMHLDYRELSIEQILPQCSSRVVITGGEPLLQNIVDLVFSFYETGRDIGLETNGSFKLPMEPEYFNSVSLSPKVPRVDCQLGQANSLKILFPYLKGITAYDYYDFRAEYKSIQVINPEKKEHIIDAIDEVKRLGGDWRLGIQIHKFIGVK